MYPELFGIPTYLILALLGFVAAFVLAMFRRRAYEYRILDLVAMLCASVVGIVIGARLLFVITEIPALIEHNFSWEIIEKRVINGGLVFYGGLIGALLCIYFLAKYLKLDSKRMINFVCPCFTIFHAFGRIGCLLGGCCYGVASDVGVLMPHKLADGTVKYITSVPVQLYEAIALVLITAILLLVEMDDIKKGKDSNLLPIYIALYAPARFVLEMWREKTCAESRQIFAKRLCAVFSFISLNKFSHTFRCSRGILPSSYEQALFTSIEISPLSYIC